MNFYFSKFSLTMTRIVQIFAKIKKVKKTISKFHCTQDFIMRSRSWTMNWHICKWKIICTNRLLGALENNFQSFDSHNNYIISRYERYITVVLMEWVNSQIFLEGKAVSPISDSPDGKDLLEKMEDNMCLYVIVVSLWDTLLLGQKQLMN